MPVADRVQEAVNRRADGAHSHYVGIDDVDADLHADDVGWRIARAVTDGTHA